MQYRTKKLLNSRKSLTIFNSLLQIRLYSFNILSRSFSQKKKKILHGPRGRKRKSWNVTGRPRYGPLRKANFLRPSLSRTGPRPLYHRPWQRRFPGTMPTVVRLDFAALSIPRVSMRMESVSENRRIPSSILDRFNFRGDHLISSNFGSNRRGKSFSIVLEKRLLFKIISFPLSKIRCLD